MGVYGTMFTCELFTRLESSATLYCVRPVQLYVRLVVGGRHCGPPESKLWRCKVGARPFHFLVYSITLKVHVY